MATVLSLEGLDRLARDLAHLEGGLRYVGERAVDVILEEGRRDTGGDLILSNFARGRVKLDAEVTVRGTTAIVLKAVPPGPWKLLEAGSWKDGYWIPRKSRKGRLAFPDGNVRNYVHHGKQRARHTFTRARTRIERDAARWLGEWIDLQIQKAA